MMAVTCRKSTPTASTPLLPIVEGKDGSKWNRFTMNARAVFAVAGTTIPPDATNDDPR